MLWQACTSGKNDCNRWQILWLAGGERRLRSGHLWLGDRFLWPTGLPECCPRRERMASGTYAHFLVGAFAGANVPPLYRRFGIPTVTKSGALCLALGVFGWATAVSPSQLFVATALSGAGWGAMSAAAHNAIVSPWFVRTRPAALAMAYNGGSIGGVIFSPSGCLQSVPWDLGPDAPVMAPSAAPYVFAAAGIVQALAIAAFVAGRYR
jgi:hypothetical protein